MLKKKCIGFFEPKSSAAQKIRENQNNCLDIGPILVSVDYVLCRFYVQKTVFPSE